MDVRYIKQDGVVVLTLCLIEAKGPVWLGMRGGSTAECYMNRVCDISNPLKTTEINPCILTDSISYTIIINS